ncbi:hypothetical protein EV174_002075 [Coemansia sp. RSA 2320]|nr:hypothetical protein EV174_002075 [Coemansia sp. RSA 2320]
MDSDSDDGILMFVPAALQSNPPTPTRLSMVGSGTGSITYEGDASHFQPHSDSYYYNAHSHRPGGSHPTLHATAGLQAFPRPRDSYDAADSIAANGNGGDICNPPIDSRLERRKKNQYKRHGSLTLAWQQRLSNNSMRDPAQTKTRLSSEIIDSADSGSPIPTPATGSWYRPHQLRNSGSSTALFSGQSRHDKVRRPLLVLARMACTNWNRPQPRHRSQQLGRAMPPRNHPTYAKALAVLATC